MKNIAILFLCLIPFLGYGDSESELILSVGAVNGGGSEEAFPLDGDLDSLQLSFRHQFASDLMFEIGYQSRDGEYTLTDGQETDYDSDELKLKLGYRLCDQSECGMEITPYTGYIKFDAENDLNAFGVDISVDQEVTKIPVGIEVWAHKNDWSYGADISMSLKSKDEQKIDVLGIDQESESNWSFELSIPVRYRVNERIFLEARYTHLVDKFEDEAGDREAEERNNQFTLGLGVIF